MKNLFIILFTTCLPLLSNAQPFNNPDGMMKGAIPNTPAIVKIILKDGSQVNGILESTLFNTQGFITKLFITTTTRKEGKLFVSETNQTKIFKSGLVNQMRVLSSPNKESLKLETIMTCDNQNSQWTWTNYEQILFKGKPVLAFTLFNNKNVIYHNPRSSYTDFRFNDNEKKKVVSTKIDTDFPYSKEKFEEFYKYNMDTCNTESLQLIKIVREYEVIKKVGFRNSYYSSYLLKTQNGILKFNKKNYEEYWSEIFPNQELINSILIEKPELKEFKQFLKLAALYNQ